MERNLFQEIADGFEALAKQRVGEASIKAIEAVTEPTSTLSSVNVKSVSPKNGNYLASGADVSEE
jgi:hypothetical protein